jgi:hypothetical protein
MFPWRRDTPLRKEATKIMTSTCIVTIATVVVAVATVVAAIAAGVYAFLTNRLLSEQRASRLDDKFPYISVRAREDLSRPPGATWEIRLVNIGRGPAFIEYFETTGLPSYPDGVHTGDIDKVIGPDVGDPHLQVAFALGPPANLRLPSLTIVIRYRDIAGRVFTSGITAGEPVFEPPEGFCGILSPR